MYIVAANKGKDQELPLFKWFFEYLPPKPYCTDMLGFLLIRPKATAIQNAYIQYNPITRAYWLVYDVDHDEPWIFPDESGTLPCPNFEIRNPENGHQHLFYLIDPAVYTLRQARRKPLELAADVDRGLTAMLEADPGFGKLIAKNPLHKQWFVILWHDHKWGLTELIDKIPAKYLKRKWKPKEEIGLGRNCTVFEKTRVYAYGEWRRLKFYGYEELFDAVYEYAMNLNEDFITPMLEKEVLCIVRSVSKWTAKHMTAAGFSAIQKARNLKSQAVRGTKSQERADEIRAFKAEHPAMSNRMIAQVLECALDTVNRALKE